MVNVLFVWTVVLFDSETLTISKKEERYIQSLQMWLWQRMIKVKWPGRVRNDEVESRTGERKLLKVIRKRKHLDWAIHCVETGCS